MTDHSELQSVYSFWFPVDLSRADLATHWRMLTWWMQGGASEALGPFAPLLKQARAGSLDYWAADPRGRLSLIIVLDQFPRGLHADTAEAYLSDATALQLAEEGFRNGHYEALTTPFERFFFLLPLVHAEGPYHLERMTRVVLASEQLLEAAPAHLRPVWEFSLSQAKAKLEVITRFGRFPHRNPLLGRPSTAEEAAYIAKGDFVHRRSPPRS